jgi:hypothetical protein
MQEYRFDEDFDYMLEKIGEPYDIQKVDEAVIEKYKDKLPEQLFKYWREIGWCGFGNGLLWMVNPAEYEDILTYWLTNSDLGDRDDLSVIARSAFGELYVWASKKGKILTIDPHITMIMYDSEKDETNYYTKEEEDERMQSYWGILSKVSLDFEDESDQPLFDRALQKLGPLKSDEMYGFKHHYRLGGKMELKNLEISKLEVYQHSASQLPRMGTGIEGLF